MKQSELQKIIREEIQKELNEQEVQESLALAGTIALGVAGGLVGLWALIKGGAVVGHILGASAEAIGDKMKQRAKQAITDRNKAIVSQIIKKFEGDTKLVGMYKALPAYSTSITQKANTTNKERTKQLKAIAEYIKTQLTPEEMKYFNDISATLRTQGTASSQLPEATLNEGGTAFSENMWAKELEGKKIVKASVLNNGPDLIIKCDDGSIYTLRRVAGLVKWDS